MPRKTKKKKLLAQNRTKRPVAEKVVTATSKPNDTQQVEPRKPLQQLPLISTKHHSKSTGIADTEAAQYFKTDITKTAIITAAIVVLEIVLYQLMNAGVLDKWFPAFKI